MRGKIDFVRLAGFQEPPFIVSKPHQILRRGLSLSNFSMYVHR